MSSLDTVARFNALHAAFLRLAATHPTISTLWLTHLDTMVSPLLLQGEQAVAAMQLQPDLTKADVALLLMYCSTAASE